MTKNGKNVGAVEKIIHFFPSKITIFIPLLPRRTPRHRRSLQATALKREHPALLNI
jgi:hypothetical protein